MASIAVDHIEDALAALKTGVTKTEFEFNFDLEHEVQTPKPVGKLVPCRECKRPIFANAFYAPAKAICSSCKGESNGAREASVGQPVPGVTDPAKAVDLTKTLINPAFAKALCPVHPEDPEHEMLLVNVSHNDNYGPSVFMGYVGGKPSYKQIAKGETVVHQCQHCLATVSYTTARVTKMKPINEPRKDADLGVRPGKQTFLVETLVNDKREEIV